MPKIKGIKEIVEEAKCANCGKEWPEAHLNPVKHLYERVKPGGVVPSGECPDCGALCYPDDPGLLPPESPEDNELRMDQEETPEESATRKKMRGEYVSRFWRALGSSSYARDELDYIINSVLTDGQLKALVENLETTDEYDEAADEAEWLWPPQQF